MAAKHKVIAFTKPMSRSSTAAERRAEQIAALSTKQAELKQEAAERRAQRAKQNPAAATKPGTTADAAIRTPRPAIAPDTAPA